MRRKEPQEGGPCFDTGRMETPFPPIGKTGTGLAEQRADKFPLGV